MGDVLMTTPILRCLRRDNPGVEIHYETKCPHMLIGNPRIDVITSRAQDAEFDRVCNLSYEDRPGEIIIDVFAEQAGVKLDNRKMEIWYEPKQVNIEMPYAVFHTGRSWPSKTWPLDRFAQVAGYLVSRGFRIVQVGDYKTSVIVKSGCIDARDMDFRQIVGLLKKAKFFIGIDSLPAHMAKAVGCPAFVIYGCTDPNLYICDAEEYPISALGLDCAGCRNRTKDTFVACQNEGEWENACLKLIHPEVVIWKIEQWMGKYADTGRHDDYIQPGAV